MGADYRALDLPLQLRNWRKCGLRFILASKAGQELEDSSANECPGLQLPEPWHRVWSNISSLRCPLIWTYFELGPDLLEPTHNQRLELFSKICGQLEIPNQWIAFWPLAEKGSRDINPRAEIFWQGVAWIKPSYLAVFGQKAMQVLYPDKAGQYGFYLHLNPAVLYLPGPEDMLPDNRQAKAFVWQMLLKLQKKILQG
ncbi:MAG: hypothetical protein ACOC43_05420 [Desulfohalobiaceae bacterium]